MGVIGDTIDWLTGRTKETESLAPPMPNYPTTSDANYARQYGFGYGSGNEPYYNNQQANILGQNVPIGQYMGKGKGQSRESMFIPGHMGNPISKYQEPSAAQNVDLTNPANADLRGIMDNTYMRAALAANRIPLASAGYDPRHFNVDAISGPMSIAGGYLPIKDQGFSTVAPDDSLVHESIHRGIQKMKEAYPNEFGLVPNTQEAIAPPGNYVPPSQVGGYRLPEEEWIVRHLMKTQAGNPETQAGHVMESITGRPSTDLEQIQASDIAYRDPWYGSEYQKGTDKLNELAIRYNKERRGGGGPR